MFLGVELGEIGGESGGQLGLFCGAAGGERVVGGGDLGVLLVYCRLGVEVELGLFFHFQRRSLWLFDMIRLRRCR